MFLVFFEGSDVYTFTNARGFLDFKLKMWHKGYRAHYSHSMKTRSGDYIYCYQLRKI